MLAYEDPAPPWQDRSRLLRQMGNSDIVTSMIPVGIRAMDFQRVRSKLRSDPKYLASVWVLISLMWSGLIWFVYWNMKDLLYAGPPPMLTASPVGISVEKNLWGLPSDTEA